jgi:RimJ/RimL family protein N-acetyltransferase
MRREGLSKRRLYCRGDWQDIVIYAMTAEEMGISPPRGRLIEK